MLEWALAYDLGELQESEAVVGIVSAAIRRGHLDDRYRSQGLPLAHCLRPALCTAPGCIRAQGF